MNGCFRFRFKFVWFHIQGSPKLKHDEELIMKNYLPSDSGGEPITIINIIRIGNLRG